VAFPCLPVPVLTVTSEARGTKIRVDNIHYELTEEDLDVRLN